MVMLYCIYERGSINLHADTIDGVQVPVRRYTIAGHFVFLDGTPGVVQHDVQALLSNPIGGYRFPTPAEQEAFARVRRSATMIQEGNDA